ncbi:DUF3530 family protein [Methylotuvimicrobium alcaliphilum]|uniref:DUF3530 family protein n=1 Tax=Methylotuvimicrobium alcaliphilum (strain DSM 19304 / NCIMB 14124 / VKM B-2133 / 20Z) TaxID=1091494 RepID=G4T276_META2|nr:DUF3530 family protein [Methylotuvimicrobium alcaliphilum]CCE22502.1 conserved exported protein of unknown function [Methylotuvimicrobium alcaliphilum 20Z]
MNRLKYWLVLIGGFWSFVCGATDVAREADFAERIAATLYAGEIVWLQANDRKFLSIYTETEYPDIKEAAIILHDKGADPDRKPLIHGLRTELPKHRWSTLAIQMPLRESGAKAEDYFDLFVEATARLRAAVKFLEKKEYETIAIVGHGMGALMALQAQSALQDDIKALAMIDIPVAGNRAASTLEWIRQAELPILDLLVGRETPIVAVSAAKRRLAAKDNTHYRQVSISADESMMVKRVYSWLRRAIETLASAENDEEADEKEPAKNKAD